ncbi:hypothetical protein B0H66DRAFT_637848 [Apodospora peruviana]|uniref:Yeast cell wall synthesis Kre9/Knh1-like N-terminal domain-containing protein n=1 Tax=Apodospora peruviana TaxID=516989 RepID=A0AAE0IK95_9PEZI|nr:hypothetical protein B0H66DRAFT_637848 [Apodospora peruviana]
MPFPRGSLCSFFSIGHGGFTLATAFTISHSFNPSTMRPPSQTRWLWLLATASLFHSSLAVVFTNSDWYNIEVGKPFTIEWDEADEPVSIVLVGGNIANFAALSVIVAEAEGSPTGSYVWTPPSTLSAEIVTFALQIEDANGLPNYSPTFTIKGLGGEPVTTDPDPVITNPDPDPVIVDPKPDPVVNPPAGDPSTPTPTPDPKPSTGQDPTTPKPGTPTPVPEDPATPTPGTPAAGTPTVTPDASDPINGGNGGGSGTGDSGSNTGSTPSDQPDGTSGGDSEADSSGSSTTTSTASGGTAQSSSSTGGGGLSTGAKAGLGAGAGIAALAVVAGIAFLMYRRRGRKAGTIATSTARDNNDFDDSANMAETGNAGGRVAAAEKLAAEMAPQKETSPSPPPSPPSDVAELGYVGGALSAAEKAPAELGSQQYKQNMGGPTPNMAELGGVGGAPAEHMAVELGGQQQQQQHHQPPANVVELGHSNAAPPPAYGGSPGTVAAELGPAPGYGGSPGLAPVSPVSANELPAAGYGYNQYDGGYGHGHGYGLDGYPLAPVELSSDNTHTNTLR